MPNLFGLFVIVFALFWAITLVRNHRERRRWYATMRTLGLAPEGKPPGLGARGRWAAGDLELTHDVQGQGKYTLITHALTLDLRQPLSNPEPTRAAFDRLGYVLHMDGTRLSAFGNGPLPAEKAKELLEALRFLVGTLPILTESSEATLGQAVAEREKLS